MSEWLDMRKKTLSGTDMGVILGVSPFKSAYTLFMEKTGKVSVDDIGAKEFVQWGNKLEPIVIEEYAKRTGRPIIPENQCGLEPYDHEGETKWVAHDETIPYLSGTPDGVIENYSPLPWEDHADRGYKGPGILEIKCVNAMKVSDWDDGIPPHYMCQIQHYMSIMNYTWGSFGVLFGGQDMRIYDVSLDIHLIEDMNAYAQGFWKRLQEDNPPPVDGTESDTETVKKLTAQMTPGKVIELPSNALELVRAMDLIEMKLKPLSQAKDVLDKKKKSIQSQIKLMMGDAELAGLPGTGITFTHKKTIRKPHMVQGSEYRVLRKKGKLA